MANHFVEVNVVFFNQNEREIESQHFVVVSYCFSLVMPFLEPCFCSAIFDPAEMVDW